MKLRFSTINEAIEIKESGVYCLCFELPRISVIVGKLGKMEFKKGKYVYVGSAMGGIGKRIKVHLNLKKKKHWHIDYLMEFAKLYGIFWLNLPRNYESIFAKKMLFYNAKPIKNFGCTDTRDGSHLFLVNNFKFLNEIELDQLQNVN